MVHGRLRTATATATATAALLAAALVAGAALAPAAHAQRDRDRQREDNSFRWQGRLAEGSWIRVKNLNGSITVQRGAGERVDVQASKSWKRGDPDDVRFEVVRDGENVTICALWYDRSSCDAESYNIRSSVRRMNDVAVEITVRLPAGVRINAQTINGSVAINGAEGEVVAKTVNGRIDVAGA